MSGRTRPSRIAVANWSSDNRVSSYRDLQLCGKSDPMGRVRKPRVARDFHKALCGALAKRQVLMDHLAEVTVVELVPAFPRGDEKATALENRFNA